MESIPIKANRHFRFQECLPTENSQSVSNLTHWREDVNGISAATRAVSFERLFGE